VLHLETNLLFPKKKCRLRLEDKPSWPHLTLDVPLSNLNGCMLGACPALRTRGENLVVVVVGPVVLKQVVLSFYIGCAHSEFQVQSSQQSR
jgi:hypothetical protein